jgi:non-specific serine/threonine protein kinase
VLLLGGRDPGDLGDAGPALDARAVSAYRARLEDLRDREREADAAADTARAERARAEIESIAAELAAALGLGGRNRRAASAVERARSNVQRRIKDAIRRIEEQDKELGRYLSWTVRTGTFCVFDAKIDADD